MAWNKILSSSHNGFGLCGAYWNGKFYIAGYGAGQLVSAFPETLEIDAGDEAIFDIVPFKETLFAPSEQNSTTGTTRVWKKTAAGWIAIPIPGYATYFMTANDNGLYVSATHNVLSDDVSGSSIDMYATADGSNFIHMGNTGGWIWVPVIYKNEVYVLGHGGAVYEDNGVAAVKWNGSGWSTVSALTGFAGEWQCGCEHNGYLFCGSGGWTTNRSTPGLAKLYRFDGNTVTLMLTGPNHSELSAVASIDGVLYAAFDCLPSHQCLSFP